MKLAYTYLSQYQFYKALQNVNGPCLFANFCANRPCQRGYITLLICHVVTHHHAVKRLFYSIGGFFSS